MRTHVRCFLATAALLLAAAVPATAQEGVITGRVTNSETGRPLEAVQVSLIGSLGTDRVGGLTGADGVYRLRAPSGTYAVVAEYVGYASRRIDGVGIRAGETRTQDIQLDTRAFELNPIVITSGRREEKALESPSTIVTIGAERITEVAALSPIEHVKALPGVDVSQTGLTSSNVVTRGFNNVFSGSLLVITDNRYAHVPSLRFNAYNMIATTQSDVDRMEVLLGPAAALYGPNAANGVLHIITKSPIDHPGTTASLAAGERSVLHGQFRTAHRISERAGIKASAQYFRGNEWEYRDSVEVQAARQNPTDALIGNRDFDAERFGGELRFDWRPSADTELVINAGANTLGSSIELTGVGAGQASDWLYSYAQARVSKGRLFAQAFANVSDAGDTYLLRTGQPIIDKSQMFVAQVQHGLELGERQDFIYGIDFSRTIPKTEGTITGRNEDDDEIQEIGAYLHSKTALTDKLDLVAAVRVDDHNRLEDVNVSPRAALVFQPQENQSFRLSYNRAFSTPTTNNLFLDLRAARIPINAQVGYDIRTLGVFASGFTFEDTCQGGLQGHCMYSPFAPGQQLPANGLPLWNGLVQALVPAQLQAFLLNPGSQPGDPDIGSRFLRFNQESAALGQPFIPDEGPDAIAPITSTIHNTIEAGYQGILGGKLLLAGDVYTQRIRDFVGPLRVETPNVFYTPESVQAFVTKRLGPLIQAGAVTPAQAEAIIKGFASVPLGTVAPDQVDSSDLILTYRNFGDVDFWGADLSFQLLATEKVSFTGTYSHVSEDCFELEDVNGTCANATDVALNAPKNKGSLGARWDDKLLGLAVEGRARWTAGFPMNSGVYIGELDGFTVFDANVAYRLRTVPGATVSLTATNLFDAEHQQFIGAPAIGRLLLLRLSYTF